MKPLWPKNSLQNEADLINQCQSIEGLSFAQLASKLGLHIPEEQNKRKGWTGLALELALGSTAGTKSIPDFVHLGIELKTLPLNEHGKPAESTFITSIPLLTIHQQTWLTSQCYAKLRRVLWVPVEGDKAIPFMHRRIGRGLLWSPDAHDMSILANDWSELVGLINTGRLDEIDATMGEYLQIRPKAANGKSLCYGFDGEGNKVSTLPRGFYLRCGFTERVLQEMMGGV